MRALVFLVVSTFGLTAYAGDYIASGNKVEKLARAAGCTVKRSTPSVQLALVGCTSTQVAKLKKAGGIVVTPNGRLKLIAPVRTAPFAGVQSTPPPFDDDFLFFLQWDQAAIDAPGAWAVGQRGAGVRVAVIDTPPTSTPTSST